jgi:hypothetical protein
MRLKVLNGAPLCTQLDFTADALLDPRGCDEEASYFWRAARKEDEPSAQAKWRHLANASSRLRSGWSQVYLPGAGTYEGNSNFSFVVPNLGPSSNYVEQNSHLDATNIDDTTTDVDNFLQHSLLLHDTLLSSQIAMDAGADNTISSSIVSASFASITTDTSSPVKGESVSTILNIPSTLNVTSLNSLPSAPFIRSIYPQTPTRNVICVVMAQPEQREVIVRKGGYRMLICEINVADDTKAGFRVSFWLRPPKQDAQAQDHGQEALRMTLQRSKAGDILLLRNVVLNVFRNDVYGQSLNPSIARARTTIEVLKRVDGLSAVNLSALPAAVVETFMRVKKWANVHVAADLGNARKRKKSLEKNGQQSKRPFSSDGSNETLPPDTMES